MTSIDGRLRRPEVSGEGTHLNLTQIVNFPIQASCTDFLKRSLWNLYSLIKFEQFPAIIVLSAHNEIILECRVEDAEQVQEVVRKVMVSAPQDILSPLIQNAPVEVDIGIGQSWADKP
uniref:Putative DNA polymerase I n=1 Tax=Tydemania expeditionis TaxID=325645 RepID=A0A0D6E1L2_TYDEX|nr:putative DNA polymerase I [Tydemania expeditionis]CEO91114.1 putative DNA polymerase I [Tydemania expeditionis]